MVVAHAKKTGLVDFDAVLAEITQKPSKCPQLPEAQGLERFLGKYGEVSVSIAFALKHRSTWRFTLVSYVSLNGEEIGKYVRLVEQGATVVQYYRGRVPGHAFNGDSGEVVLKHYAAFGRADPYEDKIPFK